MLTDCFPYILVLWGGIFRQPKSDYLVLCVCESAERVNQFLKGVGKDWLKQFLMETQFPKKSNFIKEQFYQEIWVCLNS